MRDEWSNLESCANGGSVYGYATSITADIHGCIAAARKTKLLEAELQKERDASNRRTQELLEEIKILMERLLNDKKSS